MSRYERVERPTKKGEFEIVFGTNHAQKGWRDLKATRLSGLVDAWDYLTKTPQHVEPLCYPLKDNLEFVEHGGQTFTRWQRKLSATHGARIWFFVSGQQVVLEKVFTNHPNETK